MKKTVMIAGVVIICTSIGCAGAGIYQYLQEKNAGEEYEKIREEVKKEPETEPEETPETVPVEIPIDFKTLQERNPEIYAWITIPGTAVDYPIFQSETDNSYYLTHSIDGDESPEGCIFTEDYNSKDFEDPNTVIYGHDMKNGSMFQNLLNYQDRTYFDANREVKIYTPDAIRHYRIFAAYLYDDRHLMQSFDFTDPMVHQEYLDRIFGNRDLSACIDTGEQVRADDKIITLSTCYGTQDHARYLVQAVLVSIEK